MGRQDVLIAPPTFVWPNASNTGTSGTLGSYSGPGGFDGSGGVVTLDSIILNDDLRFLDTATGTATNCLINGHVDVDSTSASLTLTNCEINAGSWGNAACGFQNVTYINCNIYGGITAINASNHVIIQSCYLHDQFLNPTSADHLGGFLCSGGGNISVKDSYINAQIPDNGFGGGESGTVQMFGDFDHLNGITFDHCYIDWTTGGYAMTCGLNPTKNFGSDPKNIVVKNCVFGRGPNGKGGVFGTVTSFDASEPSNIWLNNTWADDGTAVPSDG